MQTCDKRMAANVKQAVALVGKLPTKAVLRVFVFAAMLGVLVGCAPTSPAPSRSDTVPVLPVSYQVYAPPVPDPDNAYERLAEALVGLDRLNATVADALGGVACETSVSSDALRSLSCWVEANEETLVLIRKAVQRPQRRLPLQGNGLAEWTGFRAAPVHLNYALYADALLHEHASRPAAAAANLEAMLRLALLRLHSLHARADFRRVVSQGLKPVCL